MAKLFTIGAGKLNTFNGRLNEAGMTAEEVDLVQADKEAVLAGVMLNALRGHLKTATPNEAERRRAAEEANRIVIMDTGYDGGPAEEQRCRGPYLTYPTGWTPKSAFERRDILKPLFPGVDFGHVEELAQSYYMRAAHGEGRKLILPKYADGGLLVVPKLDAAAKCLKKPKKSWHVSNVALEYILGVFKELNPSFENYLRGKIGPEYLRLLALTAKRLAKLDAETPGDVLVLPYQAGALFAGYSVRSSRSHMAALKFHIPADAFTNLCRGISDRESFANDSLFADCPGSERAPHADGDFCNAPCLYVNDGRFKFDSNYVDDRNRNYGSTSLVVPAPSPSE